MTNPSHYSNIDREPHQGDRVVYRSSADDYINTPFVVRAGLANPQFFDLVQAWWDVDAKPGAKWKDRDGRMWTKRDNGLWARGRCGVHTALHLEQNFSPGEPVTPGPKPAPIPEPTAPGVVVRGTIDGKTVRAIRECDGGAAWTIYSGRVVSGWLDWTRLLAMLDGAPTIIDTDQPTGLTEEQRNLIIRLSELFTPSIEDEVRAAFPEVFASEPGADIPDEVVEAACRASGVSNPDSVDCAHMRAALAAADAKRTELEEQA